MNGTSSTRIIEIATLDFGQFLRGDAEDKARFAEAFAGALEEIGFAVLTGHGVDPALYDEMQDAVLDLFTSTPLEQKMRFRAERYGSVNQGYFPIEETSDIHPDLVEGWVWCRRAFDIPQECGRAFRAEDYWPDAEYERPFRKLVLAHEQLFKPIAQAMFMGLGVDPHIYDRKLTGTNFGLRLNYYPPMSAEQDRSGAGRLLGHEDVDLFTILPATAHRWAAGLEPSHAASGCGCKRRPVRSSSTPAITCSGSRTIGCHRPRTGSASRATGRI